MEAKCDHRGLLSLGLELWKQETSADPAQNDSAESEVHLFTEENSGLRADHHSEDMLEEDGRETLTLGLNMSQRAGPAHREENHIDQQPEQLSQAQQDPADARGRRRGRPRRQRMQFSFMWWQVQEMESVFQETQYPDVLTRWKLARDLNVPEPRVQVWFNNRRAKYRKSQRKALLWIISRDSLHQVLMNAEAELF